MSMQTLPRPYEPDSLARFSTPSESEPAVFGRIMDRYIRPLIHGSQVRGPFTDERTARIRPIEVEAPGRIRVRLERESEDHFILERPVPFSPSEVALLTRIAENLAQYSHEQYALSPVLIGSAIEQAIAWSMNADYADTVYQVLQIYTQWASETHEGKRTAHTTGIYCNKTGSGAGRFSFPCHPEWLKQLGSTPDTLLAVAQDGSILGTELVSSKLNNYKKDQDILAPIGTADIAMWANTRHKVAVSLTDYGDILVFRNKQLVFAKRRSCWRSFPHSLVIREVIPPSLDDAEQKSRKAVYLTALDIALMHRGACLGVFPQGGASGQCRELVRPEMLFSAPVQSPDARLLSRMVGERKFYEIPRKLRVELCSLDGALLLDASGTILTAGAIVKTEGNAAAGGGRSAAARSLARRGFGIKISNDGYIEIFCGENPPVQFA